jgi:hypothetical protein
MKGATVPVSLGSACAAARTPPGKAMIKMCGPFGSQDNVKRPQVVIMQRSSQTFAEDG